MLHNYTQGRGGADESTEQDIALLRSRGHTVEFYARHNDEIQQRSPLGRAQLLIEPSGSPRSYREIQAKIRQFRPDLAHIQSFFPLISPSAYAACRHLGVPVVQTLREYRLLCPAGWLFREGKICETCLTGVPWAAVQHGCYRRSRLASIAPSLMLTIHRFRHTWRDRISHFTTPTAFARQKFIEGGIPPAKLTVRPNFLANDPAAGQPLLPMRDRPYALYVGRLSPEKGLFTLLDAWRSLPDIPLKIIGAGDIRPQLERRTQAEGLNQVEFCGFMPLSEVLAQLRSARFLIMPSLWYETFGRTIMEAYALGTPAIVSNLGAMADLVEPDVTGWRFEPGNAAELAQVVHDAWQDLERCQRWSQAARDRFLQQFSAEPAYHNLMQVYQQVCF